jgi:hypothetical protein
MTIYVFNTLITPIDFDQTKFVAVKYYKINVLEAKELLSKGFVSAIGHEATAQLLSKLLGIPIPSNRITIFMKENDIGLHFFLKERLPEGKVLTEEELKTLQYWLVKSKIWLVENNDDN